MATYTKRSLFSAFVLSISLCYCAAAVQKLNEAPWFCHDIDCPQYAVEQNFDGLELRSYESGVWVSTNVSDVSYSWAIMTGFNRLFNYISGRNVEKTKIDMTAPVRTKVFPGEGPFCKSFFTVSFFVPFELESDPPEPTENDIYIDPIPATKYYVSSYGGYTSESDMLKHAADTVDILQSKGYSYDASYFYSAGYDPPFRIVGRHNEIWIPFA